ncbi:MAG TPA: peptide-methionine (S)-S-oxide reductase MsrA [candidate division Zixibacteria bacterium]|nr:peptide-methionine (S)-S-oxide reductase MsrA [candidate division Zixibacteria bacterium]
MTSGKAEIAVFGGGCFWCTEAVFAQLRGVVAVTPGYAGGETPDPTYEEVCTGRTGHAEVVRIEFDPAEIAFRDLLAVFFATHDPTTRDRQGNDVGPQYRSTILYADDGQRREAERFIAELNQSAVFGKPVVTTVEPLREFYEAEDYHRNYYANNPLQPYCQYTIPPKLQKLHRQFRDLLKGNGR